jgi:hypothetical protein
MMTATLATFCHAAEPTLPTVAKAEPLPEWNAKFAGKDGWIGGDAVYSVVLGERRVAFLLGDSLLGTVKDGGRAGSVMVNNTVGIQEGPGKDLPVRFFSGKTKDGKPAAIFTPVADRAGWLWPLAAVRHEKRLFVFLPRIEKSRDPGVLGFKHVEQLLGEVENPDDEPPTWRVKLHRLPFAEFGTGRERSWGSAVLENGEFLYIFGYDDRGKGIGKRRLLVARVPPAKITDFTAWRFRTRDDWSERATDSAPLADGLAVEFSVSRLAGDAGYVAVYTENGIGDRIVARFAPAPEGPWSAPLLLYKCPEMAKDKGVFCYSAKAHPWAARGNELVISYCINAWEFARLFKDEAVYRPKFVRVQLEMPR